MDIDKLALKRAGQSPDGGAILDLIGSPRVRALLERAAERGEAPLAAIAPELIRSYAGALQDLRVRQLVGLCISSVLAQSGFEVDQSRRRVADALPFRFGATYRRVQPSSDPASLLERLLAGLTDEEAASALRLLSKRLGVS